MGVRLVSVAWLVLAGGLAGCLGGGDGTKLQGPTETAAAARTDAGNATAPVNRTWLLEDQFGALPYEEAATADDWFLMVGASGPERNVTAFSWVVPQDALVRTQPGGFLGTDLLAGDPRDMLLLELAPIILDDDPKDSVVQWCLLAFRLFEAEAFYEGNRCDGRWHEVYATGPVRDEYLYPVSTLAPRPLELMDGDVQAGDTLYFVMLVEAVEPSEFGLALRVVDDPESDPSRDLDGFLAKSATPAPYALPRLGESAGFSLPFYGYYMSPILALAGGFMYEGWTEMITIEDALPDVRDSVAARDATLSYDYPVERGMTIAYAAVGYFTPTGQLSYSYDYHGVAASGDVVLALGASAASVWAGGAGWVVVAEGEGGARARLRFAGADPGALYGFEMYDIAVGTTLEALVGVPLATSAETWGLPGSPSPTPTEPVEPPMAFRTR